METDPRVMTAAQSMYAAQTAIPPRPDRSAPDEEWDAYCAARAAYVQAEDAYWDAYRQKMGSHADTIRRA